MKLHGGFNRKIGPNGISIDFDNRVFQIGVTGRLPDVINYANVCSTVHEIVDELLSDIQPHFLHTQGDINEAN